MLVKYYQNYTIPCTLRKRYYLNGVEIAMPIDVATATSLRTGVIQCGVTDPRTETLFKQQSTQLNIISKFGHVYWFTRFDDAAIPRFACRQALGWLSCGSERDKACGLTSGAMMHDELGGIFRGDARFL